MVWARAKETKKKDILLALNSQRLKSGCWRDLLNQHKPGEKITLALFHRDQLVEKKVVLAEERKSFYQILEKDNPSGNNLRIRESLFETR
jgi:predicted metalloprotease with PDZ domain